MTSDGNSSVSDVNLVLGRSGPLFPGIPKERLLAPIGNGIASGPSKRGGIEEGRKKIWDEKKAIVESLCLPPTQTGFA